MNEDKENVESRDKFLQRLGAFNGIQSAWCWANHEERFIVFGLFDDNCDKEGQLILSDDWKFNKSDHIASQYSNAVKHISHILEDGYSLKILPQINEQEGHLNTPGMKKSSYAMELN